MRWRLAGGDAREGWAAQAAVAAVLGVRARVGAASGRRRGERRSRLAHRAEHIDQPHGQGHRSPATAATSRSGGSSRTAGGGSSSTSAPARPNRCRLRPASRGCRLVSDTRPGGGSSQGGGGEEPGRGGSRSERTDGGAGSRRAFASRVTPASRLHRPGFDADRRHRRDRRVAERARVGSRCQGRRCRSGGRGRLRLHLWHLRDQGADAAIGRLPPPLEPRRLRPLVADGRRRAAVPAVGGAQL